MDTTRLGNRVIDDLKLVIQDAEDLLRKTGQQMDEGFQAARARIETALSSTKDGLSTLEQQARNSSRDMIEGADHYVQKHPWQSIGAGALVGLTLGLWLGRR